MNKNTLGGILVGAMLALGWQTSMAAEAGKTAAADLSRSANASLKQLYASVPLAKSLGPKALAILVFPKVTKAGLGVGGQYGEGALLKKGKAVAYYNTAGASYGLQAGAQQYSYAMLFMNANALGQLDKAGGVRGRGRPDGGRGGPGQGEDADDHDCQGRHLCLHLWPEGADGWTRYPGQQDHQDQSEISWASNRSPAFVRWIEGSSRHIFEQRYKALLVDKDNYLLQVSRYIHRNP